MMSRCSDNLHALITFQGQESSYKEYGLSHNEHLVFSTKLSHVKSQNWLTSQAKLVSCQCLMLGESQGAILTARHVQFCQTPYHAHCAHRYFVQKAIRIPCICTS